MKKCWLVGLAILLVVPFVLAVPSAPNDDFFSIFGSVTIDGVLAADDTRINFKINGVVDGATLVSNGEYAYLIFASAGDVIEILVGETAGAETIYDSGATEQINLVISTNNGDDDSPSSPGGSGSGGAGGSSSGGGGGFNSVDDSSEITQPASENNELNGSLDVGELIDGAVVTGASIFRYIGGSTMIFGLLIVLLIIVVLAHYDLSRRKIKLARKNKKKRKSSKKK